MTSLLRIGLALAWTALLAVPTLPVLVLLLPSRRARMIVSAWYGRGLSWGALRLLGVTATLEGAEHLAAARPAVCVANHSSNLDPFLAMDHNPIGYVGVAKREIVSIPVFGLMYVLSGHVRIDRGDSKGAVASLAETAALVRRHGLGFYLWPEGTMPRDGQLLPFKKGFVHLAIATGLPVIPIVVYGAADRWPRTKAAAAAPTASTATAASSRRRRRSRPRRSAAPCR